MKSLNILPIHKKEKDGQRGKGKGFKAGYKVQKGTLVDSQEPRRGNS